MSNFASLGGSRVVSGSTAIPLYGLWCADIGLAGDTVVPEDTSLVLGNLTLKAHVYRQATFAGSRMCRLVGGFGGWRKIVSAKQYALPSGLKLSLVLKDTAMTVGESVNVPVDSVIGTGFVRENRQASKVLHQIAGESWYVDPAGVTQIQAWPAKPINSGFTVEHQNGAEGRLSIATEDYASWLPGSTFKSPFLEGTYAIGGISHKFSDDGTFRLEVLTS